MYRLLAPVRFVGAPACRHSRLLRWIKGISFSVAADEYSYYFKIRNQFAYVPYAEIEQWFKLGGSTKGEGRGLGLHHVKSLCNEWEMGIRCENIEIGQENWIMFTLIVKSAGSQE